MQCQWDERKNVANMEKHGVDFPSLKSSVGILPWKPLTTGRLWRERWVALGLIGDRVHVMIYTLRGDNIRIISLRKANKREAEHYEKE
ncbi:MAG: BrnT family toxin [Deltaproteobacteria bacterium]|nr:BrnT family toxin [Deltaproteobacteria bacterium]